MERPPDLNKPLTYPVPWDVVFSLTPYLRDNRPCSFDEFSRRFYERLEPDPLVYGLENLPDNPRFVLVANHYERKGLWIAHAACALSQIIRMRYGPGDPPVRWVVTANWPPVRVGPIRIPSPGDFLLRRVARVLSCYAVPFAGSNPRATASSIRRLLRDTPTLDRPVGLFPEGVEGRAGQLMDPVPGIDRLLKHLGKSGFSVQPVRISEDGRFVFRFGKTLDRTFLESHADPAKAAMQAISTL